MAAIDLSAERLRRSWQGRCLTAAKFREGAVLMSMLAEFYPDLTEFDTLVRAVFPGYKIEPPFLTSIGRIEKNGTVVAEVKQRDKTVKPLVLYSNDIDYRDEMRRLADRAHLTDDERTEMFDKYVKPWLASDRRLDPTMDPNDPDAKRLVN